MDIQYLLWLQELREASGPVVQGFFSFLGSHAASVIIMIVPCLAFWCLDKRRATHALFAFSASSVCNQLIKNVVCCYRPWVRDARVTPDVVAIAGATGYSFPSGHTQSSVSMLVALGWQWRERKWAMPLGVAFALLVGFSRNFLGVHTPQDVLVGFLEGCLFVWLAAWFLPWVEAGENRDLLTVLGGAAVTVAFLAIVTLKPYPLDYVDGELLVDPYEMMVDCYRSAGGFLGMLLGWYAERRWVRFSTDGLTVAQMAARLVFGTAIVLVVYEPVGYALTAVCGSLWGQLLRFTLTFVVAVGVVPAAFSWLDQLVDRTQR